MKNNLLQKLDKLSKEDRAQYDENFEMINTLKQDLQKKKEKYKDNKILYDRFVPGIISSIQDLEAENQALLNPLHATQSTTESTQLFRYYENNWY